MGFLAGTREVTEALPLHWQNENYFQHAGGTKSLGVCVLCVPAMAVANVICKRLLKYSAPTVWHEFTPLAESSGAINLGQGYHLDFSLVGRVKM